MLDGDHRLRQRVPPPGTLLAGVALADQRVIGAGKRQLGNHHAAQRVSLRVKPLPEGLERQQRKALLLHEAVAKAARAGAALLTGQVKALGGQARAQPLVDALHVAPVGEQRQHRAAHGDVHVKQQVLQRADVGAVAGRRHVLCNHRGHVRVVVKARVKP